MKWTLDFISEPKFTKKTNVRRVKHVKRESWGYLDIISVKRLKKRNVFICFFFRKDKPYKKKLFLNILSARQFCLLMFFFQIKNSEIHLDY